MQCLAPSVALGARRWPRIRYGVLRCDEGRGNLLPNLLVAQGGELGSAWAHDVVRRGNVLLVLSVIWFRMC